LVHGLDRLSITTPDDRVEVWSAGLDVPVNDEDQALLSPAELRRAGGYRFAQDRHRFIRGRVVLRQVAAQALGCGPGEVGLRERPGRGPVMDGGPLISLSRAGRLVLVALSPDAPVGIDHERLDPAVNGQALASAVLSAPEARSIAMLPGDDAAAAFLRQWTLHEAWLKARGVGLMEPPAGSVIAPDADGSAQIEADGRTWWMRSFVPASGYVAAVSLALPE